MTKIGQKYTYFEMILKIIKKQITVPTTQNSYVLRFFRKFSKIVK